MGLSRSECTSWSRLAARTPPAQGMGVIAALPYTHGSQMSLTTMELHLSQSTSLFLIILLTPATLMWPRRSCHGYREATTATSDIGAISRW